VEEELQRTILETATAGEHVREGVKSLSEAFDRLGLTPNNSFTLEAIFRTQTAMAYSAGRYSEEQDPAIQEILWGYKYATVGDDRVRPSHVGFDGVTLPKDDPFWSVNTPPNGWACRCTLLSIFEKRPIVEPPNKVDVDGKMVHPEADPGFRFNPGAAWAAA
jgi:SPP1 gp7 family putative phage head morphogenesis protein